MTVGFFMKILVANVGSTSFKYRLFDMTNESVLAEGRLERIGDTQSPVAHQIGDCKVETEQTLPDYPSAIRDVIARLTDAQTGVLTDLSQLDAVGFKTVHMRGEPGTYALTEDILQRMADYNDLAPAHNPPYIQAIRIFADLYPALPLIGLFEPAFHHTIPDYAYIYGVPYEWYEKYGVRKYGFHGASHRYVAQRVPQLLNRNSKDLRIISCHLGGSASMCAIKNGQSIDTTMGFSPQDGLLNSTRNGSLDPFIIPFMMDRENLSTQDIRDILSNNGGLLGISGVSGDVRDLEDASQSGNDRARLALAAFCYGVKKEIGAFTAAMGGLDAIAFAGGIGERGAGVRKRICEDLEFLGVHLDPSLNANAPEEGIISAPNSTIKICIVKTDEERIVAQATTEYLKKTARNKM
jgi:acetate kinase